MLLFALQLLFSQDTRKSTLRKKNIFPNNCVRTYLRHDIGTHPPKPPSSACYTSHAHAPTRPPVHRAMPSTRHLSLTSQPTNTSPAHMQPGIHQSRPPSNVLRSSHYHHNQNTLTSQLKHPPHTCHPCLTNPTLPPTSLVLSLLATTVAQVLGVVGGLSRAAARSCCCRRSQGGV